MTGEKFEQQSLFHMIEQAAILKRSFKREFLPYYEHEVFENVRSGHILADLRPFERDLGMVSDTSQQPDEANEPAEADKPVEDNKPIEADKPVEADKPLDAKEPVKPNQPASTK